MQPLDQLGPPGGVVIHRKALPVRQHLGVQTILGYVNSTVAMLCHLRAPSLLMRARALATVREWKKRLKRQAHSRSIGQGGCGLPVETGRWRESTPINPHYAAFATYKAADVCFWHKADILLALSDVRFRG